MTNGNTNRPRLSIGLDLGDKRSRFCLMSLVLIDRGERKVEQEIELDAGAYSLPRWSPDGRALAFESSRCDPPWIGPSTTTM